VGWMDFTINEKTIATTLRIPEIHNASDLMTPINFMRSMGI
jgi:hypothetical protein